VWFRGLASGRRAVRNLRSAGAMPCRTFRLVLACLALGGLTSRVHGDEELDRSRTGAHRETAEGAAISGLGFGLNALGTGLLIAGVKVPGSCATSFGPASSGPCGPSPTPAEKSQASFANSLFLTGVAVSITSYALMAIGLPVWHSGAKRERALRRSASADLSIMAN
jgi:hypothetical protein